MIQKYLLDLNVLIALVDSSHQHYKRVQDWFDASGKKSWGLCPLTEAGFLRVTTNPAYRTDPHPFARAIAILQALKKYSGFQYWEIGKSWVELTLPFAGRISGHQQVTDAYLLGLAIQEDGILVTFDKGIRYLAGAEFSRNICFLASPAQ